jgi:tRNA threonylcarbamoyladenosine biosynthesis protein TsaE
MVTSPTYLLSNVYDDEEGTSVHHFDLYRLSSKRDLSILNIPEIFSKTISLIEWPDRLGDYQPSTHIAIDITIKEDDTRILAVNFEGDWLSDRIVEFETALKDFPSIVSDDSK